MYCIEESTCDIVGTFWRLGHCDLYPLVSPLVTSVGGRHWGVETEDPPIGDCPFATSAFVGDPGRWPVYQALET